MLVVDVSAVHRSVECWSWCSLISLHLFVIVCCTEDGAQLTNWLDFLHFALSMYLFVIVFCTEDGARLIKWIDVLHFALSM